MNHYYGDIIDKLGEPKWYDRLGYPRYCDFNPREVSNIYADLTVLAEVRCQGCGRIFTCAFSWSHFDFFDRIEYWKEQDIWKEIIQLGKIDRVIDWEKAAKRFLESPPFYGDPPNHPDDPAGNTMSSETTRIIECWVQSDYEWVRRPELEIHYDDKGDA